MSRLRAVKPEETTDEHSIVEEDFAKLIWEKENLKIKINDLDVRVFEMQALLQSGKGLSKILNLPELLETFMAVVREKYAVSTSTIILRDEREDGPAQYRIRATHGLSQQDLSKKPITSDRGLFWQLIQQGNVFSVVGLDKKPRFKTAFDRWDLEPLKSATWCPLVKGNEVLGVLTLGVDDQGESIPEKDYPFLQELAAIATTNVDSVLKYEKNERMLRGIQTLYSLSREIAGLHEIKSICDRTLELSLSSMQMRSGAVYLWNQDDSAFTLQSGEDLVLDRERLKKIHVEKKCAFFEDTHHTWLAPLVYGNAFEGVFALQERTQEDLIWTPEDEKQLIGVADHLASSLHKARLYGSSITDRMTGLFNTRHFEEMITRFYDTALKTEQPFCLAVCDIDFFKKFNDTHGHKAGDEVLKEVAKALKKYVRAARGDLVFRYGGEEFCVLLPNSTTEETFKVLERCREMIEKMTVSFENKSLKVTMSVGIASVPKHTQTLGEIFKIADAALYQSKSAGRNRVTTA